MFITALCYSGGAQGQEIKSVLAQPWLRGCPLGALWLHLIVMSPVPDEECIHLAFGATCTLDPWHSGYELSQQGRAKGSLEIALTPHPIPI